MNELQRKPPLNKELLKFLEERFPDKLPTKPNMTVEELRFLQGQRSVVEFLLDLFEQEK